MSPRAAQIKPEPATKFAGARRAGRFQLHDHYPILLTATNVPRLLHVSVFVGIWMWLGFGLHLTRNAYLLLGVPLTAIFQWFVRRQPISALWVREAPAFRLGLSSGWPLRLR